jgi:hypothetical protein
MQTNLKHVYGDETHSHRQKAECEAQIEGDGILPQENFEYAAIIIYALSRWGGRPVLKKGVGQC